MSRIRIGLIGAGWVTGHHLDAWATLTDRAEVVAIADPEKNACAARAAQYGIPQAFASTQEMLEATELDAVDIASPREFHAEGCLAAARHGLAILCQKPLAPTLSEAHALVAELPADTRLMVHENWRFRPHYRQISDWISAGHVGTLRQAVMQVLTSGFVPGTDGSLAALQRQPMMASLERMLLMEVLIHHVDALRFLLGPTELLGSVISSDTDAIKGEDRATLLMRTRAGAAVTLVGDFMAHGHPAAQVDQLEILGTKGAIRLNGDRLTLCHGDQTAQSITFDLQANYKASYAGAITHFLDCLASGAGFETDPADNLQTLEIIERAYSSS